MAAPSKEFEQAKAESQEKDYSKTVPKQVMDCIQNAKLDSLRQIEIAVRRRKQIIEKEFPPSKPSVSYHQRKVGNNLYWYKAWRENGKACAKYVGKNLPDDIDDTKVSISERKTPEP